MIDQDLRDDLLKPASSITAAISRAMVSPKTDISELDDLESALKHIANVVHRTRRIQHIRNSSS